MYVFEVFLYKELEVFFKSNLSLLLREKIKEFFVRSACHYVFPLSWQNGLYAPIILSLFVRQTIIKPGTVPHF